jgi:hypothetical protein
MMALMACVVVAASLLVATRLYRQYGDPAYDADVIAYTEITDAQVLIRFQVNVPSGRSATCVLRARARDGSEVGKDEVLVTAKPGEKLVVTEHRLPTTARPLVGEVLRCRDANT